LSWLLLKGLLGEDCLNSLIEIEVSNLVRVDVASEVVFKELILLSSQLYLLGVESSSEFGSIDSSFSEWVVILKEFSDSDSVSLDHIHNLSHEGFNGLGSSEIDINWLISGLSTSVSLIDHILKTGAIIQEWKILNVSKFSSVNLDNGCKLLVRNRDS